MRIICLLLAFLLPSAALADWRNDVGIFRIGLITQGGGAATLERVEPFREMLAHALNIEVEIFTSENAFTLINALEAGRVEYAILPSTSYALAWATCECVEPLVSPKAHDETDGYYSIIIATPDGPTSVNGLKDAKIGVLKQNSIIGHAFILNELSNQGVQLDEGRGEIINFDTPTIAADALVGGRIDALFGWSSLEGSEGEGYSRGTLTELSKHQNVVDISRYKILWQSTKIPHHPHLVRKKLDGEAKRILNDALLNLHRDDPIAYDAIEPVFPAGFSPSRHALFTHLIDLWENNRSSQDKLTDELKRALPVKEIDEANTTGSNTKPAD